jgi:hypothetical protein
VAKTHFPNKPYTIGTLDELAQNKYDGFLWGELQSYIWCLTIPLFTTRTFQGQMGKKYFAYPLKKESELFLHFINEWLALKQEQGFAHRQRQYWFLGKEYDPGLKR